MKDTFEYLIIFDFIGTFVNILLFVVFSDSFKINEYMGHSTVFVHGQNF